MSDVENIATDITVADIQLILQILDVCASRGAFKPAEFSVIGALATKLNTAIAPAQTDTEHLRTVGKEKAAALLEEADMIYTTVRAANEPTQFELDLGV